MRALQAGAQAGRWRMALPGRALVVALLALAAACAPRPVPPPPPPPPPVEEKPAEKPIPPEAFHRVAILAPLTGSNAPVGQSLANAANLAIADTGARGIRLTSYDTAAGGAAAAASRALADGAGLILGPLLAADTAAARAAAEAAGVPLLSFSNDAALASGGVFVLGFQPDQSVARIVEHARARGARRFAALVPQGVYGQRASVAFTRSVEAHGGQVVAITPFARDRAQLPAAARRVTDYDLRLQRATKGEGGTAQLAPPAFEALLIADSGMIAAAFTPALARFGAPPGAYLLMGTELWATEAGLMRVPAMHGAQFAAVSDERFRQLAARYEQRFGGRPSRLASLAYDAMLLAIAKAEHWEVGKPFPRALLLDPKGFVGIDGIFRFRGNIAERGLEVREVRAQGFVTAAPAPRQF
jgi:branched-chain amino acid transport system substrate-binding protein